MRMRQAPPRAPRQGKHAEAKPGGKSYGFPQWHFGYDPLTHRSIKLLWARRQGALSWELRAATSLARLWRDQKRTKEAWGLLTPVYDRFTEGFKTADLKAAKALLGDLRAPGAGQMPRP
jgi:hypothetical protein